MASDSLMPRSLSSGSSTSCLNTSSTRLPTSTWKVPAADWVPMTPRSAWRAPLSALVSSLRVNLSLVAQWMTLTTLSAPPTPSMIARLSSV